VVTTVLLMTQTKAARVAEEIGLATEMLKEKVGVCLVVFLN